MTKSDHRWISALKVDDTVIVEYRAGFPGKEIRVVTKVLRTSKTQIVAGTKDMEWKFNYSGQQKGVSSWQFGAILIHPTPARIRDVREEDQRRRLAHALDSNVDWEKVPLGLLRSIYEQVESFRKT